MHRTSGYSSSDPNYQINRAPHSVQSGYVPAATGTPFNQIVPFKSETSTLGDVSQNSSHLIAQLQRTAPSGYAQAVSSDPARPVQTNDVSQARTWNSIRGQFPQLGHIATWDDLPKIEVPQMILPSSFYHGVIDKAKEWIRVYQDPMLQKKNPIADAAFFRLLEPFLISVFALFRGCLLDQPSYDTAVAHDVRVGQDIRLLKVIAPGKNGVRDSKYEDNMAYAMFEICAAFEKNTSLLYPTPAPPVYALLPSEFEVLTISYDGVNFNMFRVETGPIPPNTNTIDHFLQFMLEVCDYLFSVLLHGFVQCTDALVKQALSRKEHVIRYYGLGNCECATTLGECVDGLEKARKTQYALARRRYPTEAAWEQIAQWGMKLLLDSMNCFALWSYRCHHDEQWNRSAESVLKGRTGRIVLR